jgi:DNA repair photolyase
MVRNRSNPRRSPGPDPEYRGVLPDGPVRGRGAQLNPPNRFEKLSLHVLGDHLDSLAAKPADEVPRIPGFPSSVGEPAPHNLLTTILPDRSRTAINHVDSPDLGFSWTLNPYRGCEHGCIYCYARPTHEMLGFSSGVDFESKLIAKYDAPDLLRKELARPSWKGETIVMSGVTDCYQPIEARLQITRKCLAVFAEFRQPVAIVTKSRLVLRDLDLLTELARYNAVRVTVSVTSLDNELSSKLEPRAASPKDRLWAVRRLASAGVPINVNIAPVIPGINDREIPAILKAASEAGATSAGMTLVRLPYQIKELFEEWLTRHFPDRRDHVLSLIRQARNGKLYDATWNSRMTGEGPYARHLAATFNLFARRYRLNGPRLPMNHEAFRRPADAAQMSLFESN